MNVQECLKEGALKKIRPSLEMAARSLETAEAYIGKSRSNLEMGNFDISMVCSYTSMFHTARSLLFKDGFKERSHICLIQYIREKYPQLKGLANQMSHYRTARHTVLYGLDVIETKSDAESALETAQEFLKEVKPLVK